MQRPQLNFTDATETIWVTATNSVYSGAVRDAYVSAEAAQRSGADSVHEVTLHRPSLRPIYGGPTLIEALWSEMDRLMEALMTGTDAEDGGDKYRAQELAWVIAIVTNAYAPSVDRVRKEAMERWNAQQKESNVQQEA